MNNKENKVPVKAVFLVTPDDDEMIPPSVFAYFPEEVSADDSRYHMSYANGQHEDCMELFAMECTPADLEMYRPLLDELNNVVGYDVTVLDAKKWLTANKGRCKAMRRTVTEIINGFGYNIEESEAVA